MFHFLPACREVGIKYVRSSVRGTASLFPTFHFYIRLCHVISVPVLCPFSLSLIPSFTLSCFLPAHPHPSARLPFINRSLLFAFPLFHAGLTGVLYSAAAKNWPVPLLCCALYYIPSLSALAIPWPCAAPRLWTVKM